MAAIHSSPLPESLDPLSTKFSRVSITSSMPLRATVAPITDPVAIKKALFETAYEPSEKLWKDSQDSYVKPAFDPLPEGFPEVAVGNSVWDGKELIHKPELWLHVFTPDEVADVEAAIQHFKSLSLPFSSISQATFPLKVLKPIIEKAVEDIHLGVGLRVFRGLPVKSWSRKEQIIAFAGISAYVGSERFRQGSTDAVVHLRDITGLDPNDRPAIVVKGQTSGNQVFHTDSGDIIGLFTLDRAEKGGLSQLSSIGKFYNTLAASRRDILRTLAGNYKSKFNPEGRPIIHNVDGRVIAQYGRRGFFPFFEDQSKDDSIPPITEEQHLALDALHFTAEEHALDIDLQPGDLEFFSNLLLFHARTASEDSKEHSRHLIRVWIRNEKYALDHGRALDKQWEGLKVTAEETWPLEAWEKRPREA